MENNDIVIKQEPLEGDEDECFDYSHGGCNGENELLGITAVKEEVKIEPSNDSYTDNVNAVLPQVKDEIKKEYSSENSSHSDNVYAVLPEVKDELKKEYSSQNSSPLSVDCDVSIDPNQEDQYYSRNYKDVPEDDSLQEVGLADPLQAYIPDIMPHFLSEGAEIDKILQSRVVSCHKCGEVCTTGNYMKHIQLKHRSKSQPTRARKYKNRNKKHVKRYVYPCPYCGKCPTTLSQLQVHLLTHTQEKPHKCPFCDYQGNQAIHVDLHIENKHFNIKRFKCELCDHSSVTLKSLKRHERMHVRKKEPRQCPHCEVITYKRQSMLNHIKKKHKNLKK